MTIYVACVIGKNKYSTPHTTCYVIMSAFMPQSSIASTFLLASTPVPLASREKWLLSMIGGKRAPSELLGCEGNKEDRKDRKTNQGV